MQKEDIKFQKLIDEYLEEVCFTFPTYATYLGIHKYDDNLEDYSKENIENIVRMFSNYKKKIKQTINIEFLNKENLLDYKLILNEIDYQLLELQRVKMWQRNPCFYMDTIIAGIYLLIIRKFVQSETVLKNILNRMKKISKMIEQAKENIENPPRVYLDITREVINGAISFFSEVIPHYAKKVPHLQPQLIKINNEVISCLRNYLSYIDEIYDKAQGDYRLGKQLFGLKLRKFYMIDYSIPELERIGLEVLKATQQKIELISKKINSKKKWQEVIEELKYNRPKENDLLSVYKNELQKAKEFVLEKEFVSIPPNEKIEIVETPLFMRPLTPYAAYMPPAVFEKEQKGIFYVTPVNNDEERLKAHNIYHITTVCIHEAYPGHHLQFVYANKYSTKIRKVIHRPIFSEGWAHYAEELMNEYNYYRELPTLLYHLKDVLWRACRVIIDIRLHCNDMNLSEAVKFLVTQAALEKINAEIEIKRYTMTPTYQLCYLVGKLQIMKLREEYKKLKGDKFNIKEFHDKLLRHGNIPFFKNML